MELFAAEHGGAPHTLVKITPPQTNEDASIKVGAGAYCFVIDVSGRRVHSG